MISVEQLIGELLLRHNCVIIPSFGGFVAKQLPASINYQNGTIAPPRKSLLFNRQLINNDGLLIAELAVKNELTYIQASEEVSVLVEGWNQQLRDGARISIDRVGFLFFDQERNICFEQDRFFNLLLESYGLEKVHFLTETDVQFAQKTIIDHSVVTAEKDKSVPVVSFNIEKKTETTETSEVKIVELPQLKKHTKVWRYVAAACILPIAFYSFWIPMKTDVLESGMLSIKDFNPFYHSNTGKYEKKSFPEFEKSNYDKTLEQTVTELPEDVNVFSYQFDEDLFIPVRVNAKAQSDIEEIVEKQSTTPISYKSESKFEYIVGCFGNQANAENLVTILKQKGINAYIFDQQNGLHRISAGSASSQSELNQLISEVSAQGFQGWTLKK